MCGYAAFINLAATTMIQCNGTYFKIMSLISCVCIIFNSDFDALRVTFDLTISKSKHILSVGLAFMLPLSFYVEDRKSTKLFILESLKQTASYKCTIIQQKYG